MLKFGTLAGLLGILAGTILALGNLVCIPAVVGSLPGEYVLRWAGRPFRMSCGTSTDDILFKLVPATPQPMGLSAFASAA